MAETRVLTRWRAALLVGPFLSAEHNTLFLPPMEDTTGRPPRKVEEVKA